MADRDAFLSVGVQLQHGRCTWLELTPPVEPNNSRSVTPFPMSDGSDQTEGADVLPA
jgi:hypothetical protein